MASIIGRGERAALQILRKIYGENAKYFIQYPLKKLLTEKYAVGLSSRQEKETIDIVIINGTDKVAVRVQDERHRTHTYLTKMDRNQRRLLEWSGVRVLDLHEIDCPFMFKDMVTDGSIYEVKRELGV